MLYTVILFFELTFDIYDDIRYNMMNYVDLSFLPLCIVLSEESKSFRGDSTIVD